ncbi:MAG: YkgJ family cysteine cluster protein [Bacteroidetes bacterium]|nr:MAG: YkgJ family cysteine cluster protein [Bacteroidota bacterium]
MDHSNPSKRAGEKKAENKRLFDRLKRRTPSDLDETVEELHDEVFAETDCLLCANCCKTTSPVFIDNDIARISRSLRMKPSEFTSRYLHQDEEGDYVLNSAPCAFLGPDNMCSIYEDRPRACREYPHTNRKRFYQILNLTLKNTEICPAAFEIVERLKKVYVP